MNEEIIPEQKISVERAESWMERPIRVALTTQIADRLTSNQTFYLTEDEARSLINELSDHLDKFYDFGKEVDIFPRGA